MDTLVFPTDPYLDTRFTLQFSDIYKINELTYGDTYKNKNLCN